MSFCCLSKSDFQITRHCTLRAPRLDGCINLHLRTYRCAFQRNVENSFPCLARRYGRLPPAMSIQCRPSGVSSKLLPFAPSCGRMMAEAVLPSAAVFNVRVARSCPAVSVFCNTLKSAATGCLLSVMPMPASSASLTPSPAVNSTSTRLRRWKNFKSTVLVLLSFPVALSLRSRSMSAGALFGRSHPPYIYRPSGRFAGSKQ